MTAKIDDWCRGRNWLVRLPLLAFLIYQSYSYIHDPYTGGLFSAITLGIHELGHVLFRPFGEWFSIFGGSFWQIAAPLIAAFLFLRQPDFFGVAVAGVWLGTALFELAVYVEDAATMTLPLLSIGGGDVYHDWNYLLTSIHHLEWDVPLARFLRLDATLAMVVSVGLAGWVLWRMAVLGSDSKRDGVDQV